MIDVDVDISLLNLLEITESLALVIDGIKD
jgi:hypothetical protein